MNKTDGTLLAQNLNALAEVYERKHVTAKALEVWYDTLKEFPTERIMGFLIHWPKSHNKFPTPAEIWKACNEAGSGEREQKAMQERQENVMPWTGSTEESRRLSAKVRQLLKKPQGSPKDHWKRVLETAPVGSIGYMAACEVLKVEPEKQEIQVPF